MNALDWIFIVIFALLGIRCMVKGFLAELLSVAAIFVGLLAGIFLYKTTGQLFIGWGLPAKPEILPLIVGFIAVFFIVFLIIKLIARLLEEGIEAAQLGGVDRVLGLVLGLAEGLILVSFLVIAMSMLEKTLSIASFTKFLNGSAIVRFILPIIGPEIAKLDLTKIKKP